MTSITQTSTSPPVSVFFFEQRDKTETQQSTEGGGNRGLVVDLIFAEPSIFNGEIIFTRARLDLEQLNAAAAPRSPGLRTSRAFASG